MIITFANYKGGSGKTISCKNIGSYLHKKGYRTLLTDLDPQCSLTESTSDVVEGLDVLDILQEQKLDKTKIIQTAEYDIIKGNPAVASIESHLPSNNKEFKLKQALDQIKGNYDFILVDTAPSISFLNFMTFISSDYILIPSQCDSFSVSGIQKVLSSVNAVGERYNPNLKILGIIICRYKHTVIQRQIMEAIKYLANSIHTSVFTPIREKNILLEAISVKKSIFSYSSTNAGADYVSVGNEILATLKTIQGGL